MSIPAGCKWSEIIWARKFVDNYLERNIDRSLNAWLDPDPQKWKEEMDRFHRTFQCNPGVKKLPHNEIKHLTTVVEEYLKVEFCFPSKAEFVP